MNEAYISGGICGSIWWPVGEVCGIPFRANLRQSFNRFSESATFRDVLIHLLNENGGDFQNARFTADTEIVIKKKKTLAPYKWETRVKVRELLSIPELSDLVDQDHYSGDFFA